MQGRVTKAAFAVVALHAALWPAYAQPVDPAPDIRLTARISSGQTTFRVGELIPLELSFSSTAEQKYQLNPASGDRSGRMNYESFAVEPRTGWSDPLDLYFRTFASVGGGLTNFQALSQQPMLLPLDLNEWVRFDQPGEYRVTVHSRRATLKGQPSRPVMAVSNELRLTIVAASTEWQQETLQRAVAVLNSNPLPPLPTAGRNSRTDAAKALRYLGTEAATREMAHRSQDPDCRFGLVGSPFRSAGLDEMKKLLRDPAVAVDRQFLDTLTFLSIPDTPGQHWQDQNDLSRRSRQELISAAPLKKGVALAVSVKTIMEYPREVSPEVNQSLTDLLVANFDDLPVADQTEFLYTRAGSLERELLPLLLRKVAERYQDFPQMQSAEAVTFNRASGDALQQWYALAPDDARPAILREILRPKPRFQLDVLGILPDKELPEVEQALVEHFEAVSDRVAARNLALLIGRYAGAGQETTLIAHLDRDVSAGLCDTQAPLLAWLLRVDLASAQPRLENARKAGNGCRVSLAEVGKLQPSPFLERLAIKALDDANAADVPDAAAYLTDNGSADSEEALWSHFADWSKRWSGHEAELNSSALDLRAGQSMMQALLTGHNWLVSDAKLKRMVDLAVGPMLHQQVEQYIRIWQQRPWLVRSIGNGQFQIGWYSAISMRAAKEKLQQFPKGSEFRWISQGLASGSPMFKELAQFMAGYGIRLW